MKYFTFNSLSLASTLLTLAAAQTYTSCNPLTTTCSPNKALAKTLSVDFTKGASSDFTAAGDITYGPDGASFKISKSGDSPIISSNWYIMFGKVTTVLKASAGVGIVSSAVLQSDDLDEIDWEWLGATPAEVQTNYYGKGLTLAYDRGGKSPIATSQSAFNTYTVEYTAAAVTWSINGQIVRTLTPASADANQYPQTPMQVKIGSWSAGDASQPPGTVEWAGGSTDYSKGPFTMVVKSLTVEDYSTGTEYKYSDMSGTWQSIQAIGGTVGSGGQVGGGGGTTTTVTSTSAGLTTSTSHLASSSSSSAVVLSSSSSSSSTAPFENTTSSTTSKATTTTTVVVASSTPIPVVVPSSTSTRVSSAIVSNTSTTMVTVRTTNSPVWNVVTQVTVSTAPALVSSGAGAATQTTTMVVAAPSSASAAAVSVGSSSIRSSSTASATVAMQTTNSANGLVVGKLAAAAGGLAVLAMAL